VALQNNYAQKAPLARRIRNKIARIPGRALAKSIGLTERIGLRLKSSSVSNYKLGRAAVDLILLPSDFWKINNTYKGVFGHYPNLINPITFNERIQRQKLVCRKHIHTLCADKLKARDHVARAIGEEYLTNLIWHGDHLVDFSQKNLLPQKFIIKTNQGSGSNLICLDQATFNWESACHQTDAWLRNDHSIHFAEWQYRWIKPKVIIEELLTDQSGNIPVDYKFFCFGGSVGMVQVDFDRASNHTRLLFDKDFRVIDAALQYPRFHGNPSIPKNFNHMVELAEKLSSEEEFVRVDFYDLGDRVIFGEMTYHPEAGIGRFIPESFDQELWKKWKSHPKLKDE
jgi:hypothetical protein